MLKIDLTTEGEVYRKVAVIGLDNNAYFPAKFIEEVAATDLRYTTGFKGTSLLKGIPLEMEAVMPDFQDIIGVGYNSAEWATLVKEFWTSWEMRIPVGTISKGVIEGGLIADGGYKILNGKLYPNNLNYFILVNLMLQDETVCTKMEDWGAKSGYNFYMIFEKDRQKALEEATLDTKNVMLAVSNILQRENTTEVIKQILKAYTYNYTTIELDTMDSVTAESNLFKLVKENPKAIMSAIEDKQLATNAKIADYLNSGSIRDVEGQFFIEDNKIANSQKDLRNFIRMPENKGLVAELDKKVNNYKLTQIIEID